MKDYSQRKELLVQRHFESVYRQEPEDLRGLDLELAKLEDEKRIFELRWQAFCALVGRSFSPSGDTCSLDWAWDHARLMLKAAGVIE